MAASAAQHVWHLHTRKAGYGGFATGHISKTDYSQILSKYDAIIGATSEYTRNNAGSG